VDELNYVQIKPRQHITYCICTKHREKEFSKCCLSFDGTIVINASFVKNLGIFFDRTLSGADPGFQVRGGALKKIAPSGGWHEKFGGISCEKSRFYAKKSYFFQF
jgi:hypothetical protein